MLLLIVLESLPVCDITKTHKVMKSTNTGSIEVPFMVKAYLFLSWNSDCINKTSRNIECIIGRIKELAGNVVLK